MRYISGCSLQGSGGGVGPGGCYRSVTAEAAKLGAGWLWGRAAAAAACSFAAARAATAAASASKTLARARMSVTVQHLRLLSGRQMWTFTALESSRGDDRARLSAQACQAAACSRRPSTRSSSVGEVGMQFALCVSAPTCVPNVALVVLVVRLRQR